MLQIKKDNTIELTRGDSALLDVNIYNGSAETLYELQDGDKLTLSVKENFKTPKYSFQKVVTNSTSINISPEDTKNLDFGDYFYDVQLTTKNGDVYTIIGPARFVILPEVTT